MVSRAASVEPSTSISSQCGSAPAAAQGVHLLSSDQPGVYQCANLVCNLGILWLCQEKEMIGFQAPILTSRPVRDVRAYR